MHPSFATRSVHWSIRPRIAASRTAPSSTHDPIGKIIRLLAVFAMCMAILPGCRHAPDEQQLHDAIASVAQAAETNAAGDVIAPLSDDFDGNAGELDRRGLGNMVRFIALRGEHIGVAMGPVAIEHRGERMVATFTVTLSSGSQLFPDQLGIYQVESAWRREGGAWRCYSANWKHTI